MPFKTIKTLLLKVHIVFEDEKFNFVMLSPQDPHAYFSRPDSSQSIYGQRGTKLDMDSQEFGLLKIIAIFGSEPASVNTDYYESVCDKALGELREQTNQQEARYSKLLLRLSPLRSLQQDVLEEIFFGGLIGNVQIDTVIPTLLNMEQGELCQLLEA